MTTEQKAKEIYDRMLYQIVLTGDVNPEQTKKRAKQCALICVKQILKSRPTYPYAHEIGIEVRGLRSNIDFPEKYWQEVKQEIEKL